MPVPEVSVTSVSSESSRTRTMLLSRNFTTASERWPVSTRSPERREIPFAAFVHSASPLCFFTSWMVFVMSATFDASATVDVKRHAATRACAMRDVKVVFMVIVLIQSFVIESQIDGVAHLAQLEKEIQELRLRERRLIERIGAVQAQVSVLD